MEPNSNAAITRTNTFMQPLSRRRAAADISSWMPKGVMIVFFSVSLTEYN